MTFFSTFFSSYFKKLSTFTRNLALFALVNIIVINLFLQVLSPAAYTETTLSELVRSLLPQTVEKDSWEPMAIAFKYVQSPHSQPLYSEIFFKDKVKFQYPPSSLLPFFLLDWLMPKRQWLSTLNLTNCFAVAFNILFVVKIFNLMLMKTPLGIKFFSSKADILTRNFLVVCLSLTFYPVVKALELGQIQAWLNALFAFAVWLWLNKFEKSAGIVIATMTLIKPQYLIIYLWGYIRKKHQFFRYFSIVFIAGLLVSVLAFGLENHLDYLKTLSFISKHGESFKNNNQSMVW